MQNKESQSFDPRRTRQLNAETGYCYVMIYCDAQGPEPVFFAGRMYRVEPGAST